MKGAKGKELQEIEALVSAAVGANPQRGDQVKVIARSFDPEADAAALPFYEMPWFAMIVRNGAAVLAVLLVLLLGVRPMIKALRGDRPKPVKAKKGKKAGEEGEGELEGDAEILDQNGQPVLQRAARRPALAASDDVDIEISRSDLLNRQLSLAQRLVAERPESAVAALRQMLNEPADSGEGKKELAQ